MIIPAGFRLLVRPDDWDNELKNKEEDGYTTDGGIFIPEESETVKEIQRERAGQELGTLVAVGPTAWRAYDDGHPWAKVGDRVAYAKHGGSFIVDPATEIEYILLNDNDIKAVITKEDK